MRLERAAGFLSVSPGMARIHKKMDFTTFVFHEGKGRLMLRRKPPKWLPLGGHIELDEGPGLAALHALRAKKSDVTSTDVFAS